jgi:hypothetical protein
MKEAIFFATFKTVSGGHLSEQDRRETFSSEKSLKDFHNWIEEMREKIEFSSKGNSIVTNIQFIKLGY